MGIATDRGLKKTLPADVRKALAVPPPSERLTRNEFCWLRLWIGRIVPRFANERYLEIDAILNKGTTTLVMAENG